MHLDSGHTETNWEDTFCTRVFFWEYDARFCQQIKQLIVLTDITVNYANDEETRGNGAQDGAKILCSLCMSILA